MDERALREAICEAGRRLWEIGLVGAGEGNLTARLGPDRLLCTPSGACKGQMRAEDLVVLDLEGRPVGPGSPSSEMRMHLRVYRRRPDCMVAVHAHPLAATGFALAGAGIPDDLLPEAAAVLGPVALVPFAMPGTEELADALDPFLAQHKTLLIGSHGALALGRDPMDACRRMETLERVAQIVLNARALGGTRPMPGPALERIRAEWLHGRLS